MVVAEAEKQVDEVAVRLGTGLKLARESVDMKQAELARRLGVIPNQIWRWETGERRLAPETIERAETVMGTPRGTVFRLAGYVDDDGLVDVGSLPAWASRSIKAILRDVEVDKDQAARSNGTAES